MRDSVPIHASARAEEWIICPTPSVICHKGDSLGLRKCLCFCLVFMMVTFQLDPKDWIALLTLSVGLPGYEALKAAIPAAQPPIVMTVSCNLAEAEILVEVAKGHCPQVVPVIERAIKSAST
jgi:hypothetical protein